MLTLFLVCAIDWAPVHSQVPKVDHTNLHKLAVKENKPLVIFIDAPKREIPGMIGYETKNFHSYKGILVGLPINGVLYNVEMPVTATDVEINTKLVEARRNFPRQLTGRSDVKLGDNGRILTRKVQCDGKKCVEMWE